MKPCLFGTDGIRARVGEYPIEPETVVKIGWAIGKELSRNLKRRQPLLVGKDTRVSGYVIESALEAGIASAGVDVKLIGPVPTPALAFLTRTTRACGGIIITASHNPYQDNGMKVFDADGQKVNLEVQRRIESAMDGTMQMVPSEKIGKVSRLNDYRGRYMEFCKSMLAGHLDLAGLKVVLDCANGACYKVAPAMFAELGADITVIGCEPDGYNINVDSGTEDTKKLREKVIQSGADLGIAFDGDGDRCILIDERGAGIDGDAILFILAQQKMGREGVVGTQMSNRSLELELKRLNIPFYRAAVGDRNVGIMMQQKGCTLGGEPSGHVIIEPGFTGDGISASLHVIQVMMAKNKSLSELVTNFLPTPQHRCDVPYSVSHAEMDDHIRDNRLQQWAEQQLGTSGRAVIRPSGTQKLIRIMVESSDMSMNQRVAEQLKQLCIRD